MRKGNAAILDRFLVLIGGLPTNVSEPIFGATGAAAEKPSGWGSRRAAQPFS